MKDGLRMHGQKELLHPSLSMSEGLRKRGFRELEHLKFINMRISHGDSNDALEVMHVIKEMRPDVLVLEYFPGGFELSRKCQDYIDGVSSQNPSHHAMVHPLLQRLRESNIRGEKAPLIVCADPSPDWDDTDLIRQHIKIYQQFWRGEMKRHDNFHDAAQDLLRRLTQYVQAQSKRERIIASGTAPLMELLSDDDSHRYLRKNKDIVMLGVFGATHGGLSKLFQDMGVETGAITQRIIFTPQEAAERKMHANEPLRPEDIENALVGLWIEESLGELAQIHAIKRLDVAGRTAAVWKILAAMRKEGGDFSKFFVDAKKDHIGFNVLVKEYYDEISKNKK